MEANGGQVIPLCKDCINLYNVSTFDPYPENIITVWRCKIKALDPVHGGEGEPEAFYSRSHEHLCGPGGKFFIQKPPDWLADKETK